MSVIAWLLVPLLICEDSLCEYPVIPDHQSTLASPYVQTKSYLNLSTKLYLVYPPIRSLAMLTFHLT